MKTARQCLMLALCAVTLGASAGDFRRGGSSGNNKVERNNAYAYLGSGNYATAPVAAKPIPDDRVDPNGGQDFAIPVVTPDANGRLPPKALQGGCTANYIAIRTGTGVSAVTSDGARHAQLASDTATTVRGFIMTAPLVDVDGSTFGVRRTDEKLKGCEIVKSLFETGRTAVVVV